MNPTPSAPWRAIFMGTAPLSCNSLRALLADSRFRVVSVVTQPDRAKGRNLKLEPSPVKQIAQEIKLPLLQPGHASDPEFVHEAASLKPDLIAVAAFGQILPPALLALPRYGCVNVHTSLLPKYRGAAPIQWAIIHGEKETGVTIMKMDAGLDTGEILSQAQTPISDVDTSITMHDRLAKMGAELLVATLPEYLCGGIKPLAQDASRATYAPKIKKADGKIDWNQPAVAIRNRLRGLVPWPGVFTFLPAVPPMLLKIWEADVVNAIGPAGTLLNADKSGIVVGCGTGALRLRVLQKEGGRRLTAEQFLAGHHLAPGQMFIQD